MIHGSRRTYVQGCRCVRCRAANADYQRVRRAACDEGFVPAKPARDHLKQLAKRGVGYRRVAEVARLSPRTIAAVRSGALRRIHRLTADRILAVGVTPARGQAIRGHAAWRQIDGMKSEGYTLQAIGKCLGLRTTALTARREWIRVATAIRIRAAYQRLIED